MFQCFPSVEMCAIFFLCWGRADSQLWPSNANSALWRMSDVTSSPRQYSSEIATAPRRRSAKRNSASDTRTHTHTSAEGVRWGGDSEDSESHQWGRGTEGSIRLTVSATSRWHHWGTAADWFSEQLIDWPLDWLVAPLTPPQRWHWQWTTCGSIKLSGLLWATETIDTLRPRSLGSLSTRMMLSDVVVRATSEALVVFSRWVSRAGRYWNNWNFKSAVHR